ncbi:MAG: hypothetical protein ACYC1T_06350 [Sulfuricaulis sp.]
MIAQILRNHHFWLVLLTFVTYGRVWQIQDVIWDDNAWLRSIYSTASLAEFLRTGFEDLKREPLGIVFYWFFKLHRDTEAFYMVWHGLDLVVLALTTVTISMLISRLFRNQQLAFLSGIAFIAFPLDYTIGYASAINYRIALLLMVVSLLFSARLIQGTPRRYFSFAGSLLTAGAAQYVFLEAMLASEPARYLLFAFLSGGKRWYQREHLQVALRRISPFVLLSLPLVVYKLSIPASGIHAGLYMPDVANLMEPRQYAVSLAHFIFFPWVVLGSNIKNVQPGTFLSALLAGMFIAYVIRNIPGTGRTSVAKQLPPINERSMVLLFSLFSIAPVFLLFQLIGRPISWGMDSTHAVPCQLGYALLIGYMFCQLWNNRWFALTARGSRRAVMVFATVFIAVGVFFSNLNIDQYRVSWQSQSQFLGALHGRFPDLPRDSILIMDLQADDLYSDMRFYDIEFPLNLLYARSAIREDFYQYRIITAVDFSPFARAPVEAQRSGEIRISLVSGHGARMADTSRFIFIHYRHGGLLVNQEITAEFPGIIYRSWLDRPLPESEHAGWYFPLRSKLGFPFLS